MLTDMSQEEFKVKGDEIVAKVKELVREGNIRRITIKNAEGHPVLEIPLTFGVVGALLAPTLAAVGAVAALVTDCTISIDRTIPDDTATGVVADVPPAHDATEADGG